MSAWVRWLAATTMAMAIAGCGGGGGGDDSAPPTGSNPGTPVHPAGAWLTFSPAPVEVDAFFETSTYFSVTATSSRTIAETINVAIVDNKGVISGNARVRASSPLQYTALLTTHPGLAAGTHTGHFEVRVCYDSPLTCARPVQGSPWQLPYTIRVVDPAAQSYKRWEVAQTTPGFHSRFALSHLAGQPVVVAAGSGDLMNTWTSADIGSTWTQSAMAVAPPALEEFALASDDAKIYLSGGRRVIGPTWGASGPSQGDLWKFDGAAWRAQSTSAGFTPRFRHVMAKVGGSLFVAGGIEVNRLLRDVWRSNDEGATWSKVLGELPEALGQPSCALDWQGSLLLLGQVVATSRDGVSWTLHGGYPAKFPQGSVNCVVHGNRLFLVSPDGNSFTVSSADLSNWKLERSPGPAGGRYVPGMAAVEGRLMVINGDGTSQRSVFRTVP